MLEGLREPLAGGRAGDTVARVLAELERVGASDGQRWLLAYSGTQDLFEALGPEQAAAIIRRVSEAPGLARPLVERLLLERARAWLGRQRLAEATADLDATRASMAESPLVQRWLADDAGEASPSPDELLALEDAVYWHAARGELLISMGRLAAASEPIDRAARLAQRAGLPEGRWYAFDLRVRLALALQLHEDVEPLVDECRRAGVLAAFEPGHPALRQVELRLAIARHELARRSDPRSRDQLEAMRALALDSSLPEPLRRSAARMGASLLAEVGDARGARELAATARALAPAGLDALEAAEVAAVELRCSLLDGTASDASEAQRALEATGEAFLAEWSRVAALSDSLALLQFAQRERVLEALAEGSIAVAQDAAGARRALDWIVRPQRFGGLSRALGLASAPDALELELRELTAEGRGLLVLHSGRLDSLLFLVDSSGVEVLRCEDGSSLRTLAGSLTSAATRAARSGDSSAREFDALVKRLATAVDADKLVPWMLARSGVTVVGDESVGHLPLALLHVAPGRRLGDEVALSHAPSVPVAAELSRRARARGVVAASDFDVRIVGAPLAPADVALEPARFERWRERLDGRAALVIGEHAERAALSAPVETEMLQVVAHGRYDARRATRAGFALGGAEGDVWAESIERMAMPRLIGLAVCGASLRPLERGNDGRSSLAASFLLAGADCVLQTPIDLEAEGAVDLFERASVELASGATPAQALLAARRDLGAGGEFVQPYLVHAFGAAHVAVVDSRTVPAAGRSWRWLAVACGALVLAAALRSLARRRAH